MGPVFPFGGFQESSILSIASNFGFLKDGFLGAKTIKQNQNVSNPLQMLKQSLTLLLL